MTSVSTENVNIGYDKRIIVKDFSVEIPENKVTAIIGANGSGKSTLLKAITRIIPFESGNILIDGKQIKEENTKDLAKKIAILPQSPDSAQGLTVGELVSYGRFPYQNSFGRLSKTDYEMVNWAMDMTGITDFKYHNVDTLSGGQRQRVWIAMALAQDTEIIFLDEPTTYLDMAHQLEVLELLERLNQEQERTIIMVLHDLNQAARFADHIVALQKGEIVKNGTCEEVITKSVLREVFHVDAVIGKDPRTKKPMCLTYNLWRGEKEHDAEQFGMDAFAGAAAYR
ncbi:MAG TPA: ABC transporter ATP-binding protein [Pseudogracilibacillus sp.]|nr:ABC transporter ATP-binding protein [Pseudogracilibacillus sp.]